MSNAKDQSAKLWDVRAMLSPAAARALPRSTVPRFPFDYRWQAYPGERSEDV